MIARKIGADAVKVILLIGLVAGLEIGAQEPVVAFLHQVLGQRHIVAQTRQIRSQRASRFFVEEAKGLLVHVESLFSRLRPDL